MSTAAGVVAFIILAAMIATNCVSLYISVRHLEHIESLLKNSKFVAGNIKTFSQAGLMGRVMRMLSITMILTIPKPYARRGLLDLNEIEKFPACLKRVLIAIGTLHPILIGSLIAFCIWLHIHDPNRSW